MSSENLAARERFLKECADEIDRQGRDPELKRLANQWFIASTKTKYSYHFEWLGLPIIQYPQDLVAMQEILWRVQPDLVIETGVAHGGSLIFYASILELTGKGRVLGIDIDIRSHNRQAIEAHPMFKRIDLIEGSSISPEVVARAADLARDKTVLVVLDSNHTEEHVLQELKSYA